MGKLEPGSVPGSPRAKRKPVEYSEAGLVKHDCDAGCGREATCYATHFGIMRTLTFCTHCLMKLRDALIEKGWSIGDHK